MLVELSSFIEGDLEAIADYIAQDNPMRAVSFIREIREELRLVGQNPLLYQLRPEIGEDARLAIVGRYVILFHIVGEVVRIERVIFWRTRSSYPVSVNRSIASAQLSQSQIIVHCDLYILLGAKITFCRLDGRVPEQELDLLQVAAVLPAEPGAGAAEVVGAEVLDPDLLR